MDSQVVSIAEYEELERKYDFWYRVLALPSGGIVVTIASTFLFFQAGFMLLGAILLMLTILCITGYIWTVRRFDGYARMLGTATPEILPEVKITQENGVTISLYEGVECLETQSFSGDDPHTIQAAIEYREELNARCEEMIQECRYAQLVQNTEKDPNQVLYELVSGT